MNNDPSVRILDRLLEPVSRSLNPASAKALAEMETDPVAAERGGRSRREMQRRNAHGGGAA
jgi:hypothetical protein